MKLPDSLLAPLEIGLNRYLAEDDVALSSMADLDGHVVALRLREFDLRFCMRLHGGGVQVFSSDEMADVEIEASLPSLARAMLQADAHQELTTSGLIRIDGNVELAQDFFNILRATDFDPEEWLSRHVGDIAAYRAGQFARGLLDFGRKGLENLFSNGGRLLKAETGDLVPGEETSQWMDEVDALRTSVDRVEARLNRMRAKREEA